ncbi:hypothetical protein DL98DRAFT_540462 [Cadophora sp. DSE1049]|nr:hypothetical protein DL98DRAFT_540462 [Cadophora sp. DSE1049]
MAQSMFPGLVDYPAECKMEPESQGMASMSAPTAMIPPIASYLAEPLASVPMMDASNAIAMSDNLRVASASNSILLPAMPTNNSESIGFQAPGANPLPTITNPPKKKRGRPPKDPSDKTKAPYRPRKPASEPPAKKTKSVAESNMENTIAHITWEWQGLRTKYEKEVYKNFELRNEIRDLRERLFQHQVAPTPRGQHTRTDWHAVYDFDGNFSPY